MAPSSLGPGAPACQPALCQCAFQVKEESAATLAGECLSMLRSSGRLTCWLPFSCGPSPHALPVHMHPRSTTLTPAHHRRRWSASLLHPASSPFLPLSHPAGQPGPVHGQQAGGGRSCRLLPRRLPHRGAAAHPGRHQGAPLLPGGRRPRAAAAPFWRGGNALSPAALGAPAPRLPCRQPERRLLPSRIATPACRT